MRHFRFSGDPKRNGDGPATITAYGLEFGRTTPTPVEDEAIARKLAANGHFQEMVRADPAPTTAEALGETESDDADGSPTPVEDETSPPPAPTARRTRSA